MYSRTIEGFESVQRVSVLLVLLFAATPALAEPLRVVVRDARSGAFLKSELLIEERDRSPRIQQIANGRAQFDIPDEVTLEVSAPAYSPLRTRVGAGAGDLQLLLDPQQVAAATTTQPGRALIQGHVYDFWRGRVVAGARVTLDQMEVVTDASGYFSLEIAATDAAQGTHRVLSAHASGLPEWQRTLRVVPGLTHLIVDLGAGNLATDHRFDSGQSMLDAQESGAAPRAPILAPPASIRVGFADAGFNTPCCVGACSAVSVMSLESYVRRGLNDEWIASWTGDSLRAGAIAYRSYGAWHVFNPRTPTYDICSSACCQVNDADTSASSNAAVDATAGILLIRENAVFRSEYSAENNAWDDPDDGLSCVNVDLSCGNGFVGSPAAGWPCLADSVASGRGCFGHGRGMSQWGSQRWALNLGRRWPWIVDHYYNANGVGTGMRSAYLTSPMRIDQLNAPTTASPGDSITLGLDLSNLAAQAHDPVWIGASVYSVASGFVSDPARDLAVRLDPGANARARSFVLPSSLTPGVYDVLVALYLDIDGNGAINSGDLALTSDRRNGVLTIGATPMFANGFEQASAF